MSVSSLPSAPAAVSGEGDDWGRLGAFVLGTFYVWVVIFLALWVLVPMIAMGWHPVVVTSGSMAPTVRPGDVVLLRAGEGEGLGTGTVITFADPARPGTLTTHRIVAVNPDGSYRTRGDANAVPDSTPVVPDRVVGVGRLLVPMVGLPATWLRAGRLGVLALWLVATIAAGVMALRPPGDGSDGPSEADDEDPSAGAGGTSSNTTGGDTAPRSRRQGGAWLHRVTTRRVRPGPIRAWAPIVAALVGAGTLARPTGHLLAGLGVTLFVLVLDPRGPQVPVGRWHRAATSLLRARRGAPRSWPAGWLRAATALVLLATVAVAAGQRSAATFTGTIDSSGSTLQAAASFCVTGSATVTRDPSTLDKAADPYIADTFVDQGKPDTVNGVDNHHIEIRSNVGKNKRALFRFRAAVDPGAVARSRPRRCACGSMRRRHSTSRSIGSRRLGGGHGHLEHAAGDGRHARTRDRPGTVRRVRGPRTSPRSPRPGTRARPMTGC